MNGTAVIIERIGAALTGGELRSMPVAALFQPVDTIADLLRPWGEMYPGVANDGEIDTRDTFGRGGLQRHVKFVPQVRRSCRPLPAPRSITGSPRTISPELFASVQAIWEFYREKDLADPQLPAGAFTGDGMSAFLQPLYDETSDYYPLTMFLEEYYGAERLDGNEGLSLMLPHSRYEDEGAGVFEAFLSGPKEMESLLVHFLESTDGSDPFLTLPVQDHAVIKAVGCRALIDTYAGYQGEKSCDLAKTFDWYEAFFGEVARRFPERMERAWDIIAGDGGWNNRLDIAEKADIDFAIAYADAYQAMECAMPSHYELDQNEGGATDMFVHELCNVWRKANKKRSVKWESPKRQTLMHRFGPKGDL